MRNRRYVLDRFDVEAGRRQSADGRLATRAGTFHFDVDAADAVLLRQLRGILRRHLRRERRPLARSFEADPSGAGPRQDVAHRIADRHDGVVEARRNRGYAMRNVLPLLALARLPASGRRSGFLWYCCCSHWFSFGCRLSVVRCREPTTDHRQPFSYFLVAFFLPAIAPLRG